MSRIAADSERDAARAQADMMAACDEWKASAYRDLKAATAAKDTEAAARARASLAEARRAMDTILTFGPGV